MKQDLHLRKVFLFSLFFAAVGTAFSQPTATPATGYTWAKTGTSNYVSGPISTTPSITSGNTAYGTTPNSDPTSCASFCEGSCDGAGLFGVSLFGISYGTGNQTNCEQRSVTLTQWNNLNPNSGVANGASSGIVFLPTAAAVTIFKAPTTGAAGTGAGSDVTQNRGKLYGGNIGGSTQLNVKNIYDIAWVATAFSGAVSGSASWTATGVLTQNDAGTGNYSNFADWHTGAYGNTLTSDATNSIPLGSISQTGGNFEVVFGGTSTLSALRNYGNADAFAQTSPGMEGRAGYEVKYDIWELKSTLPLRLTTFTAEKKNGTALLRWTNSTEINNLSYSVEKSTDGITWANVAVIPANLNSGLSVSYQYADNISTTGRNIYYRLKLIELNGAAVYSEIKVLKENNKNIFSLLPTGKNIYTMLTDGYVQGVVSVRATDGKIILQKIYNKTGQNIIDLSNLSAGIYFVGLKGNFGSENISVIVTQ